MLFNSLHFLAFLPIVLAIYYLTKQKYRWVILLIASYYFYMSWKAEYVILIFIATAISFYCAKKLEKSKNREVRLTYLWIAIISSLSILFTFKYFNFVSESIREALAVISIEMSPLVLNVLLPVGISFYTFQSIGYVIDVYNKQVKSEQNFFMYALYVSFFPQLVAGPIERAKNLLPQLKSHKEFSLEMFNSGLKYILWGFFLKIAIADNLAKIVDPIYASPELYNGLQSLMATYFFTFQIFCDFAGYSFIAIGVAKLVGINLMENFRRPYFSQSISEFWRRWHISLSSWFRDYIYIPMGGNRVKVSRLYFNIMTVFLVSGIWHGANWTFILWGILHGLFIVIGHITADTKNKILAMFKLDKMKKTMIGIRVFITFHLVAFTWIFFRAESINDAFLIITNIFTTTTLVDIVTQLTQVDKLSRIASYILLIAIMETIHMLWENEHRIKIPQIWKTRISYLGYAGLFMIILLLGNFGTAQFIYFQF